MSTSRRQFLKEAAIAAGAAALTGDALAQTTKQTDGKSEQSEQRAGSYKRPVIICKSSVNDGIERGFEILRRGGDTLDAVLTVCRGQEDDPNDQSVGLGGLPNEEGVVELDSCCMHGPTRRAGSVGAVRNIKNVSTAARLVMEHTGHVMLVGEGAERFAVAQGLPRENLLTEPSRKVWLLWKELHTNQDWWGPGLGAPDWEPPVPVPNEPTPKAMLELRERLWHRAAELGIEEEHRQLAVEHVMFPPHGTIHVSAVNEKGEMSGATTTSGLAWKLPGRCGDSPIIGAGCYCDQDVGSAGATGSGEENIKVAGAHTIVELMRQGRTPEEAGLETLRRIAHFHNNDMTQLRFISMVYYILRKDGMYAGVSMWSHSPGGGRIKYCVHDGTKQILEAKALYEGRDIDWPPIPEVPKKSPQNP